MRSSFHTAHAAGGAPAHQLVGEDEGQVADEDRHALAEAPRLAGPAARRRDGSANTTCVVGAPRRLAASSITSSWNRAKACISSSAAPASTTTPVVAGSPPAADAAPVAERRPEPLAAGEHEPLDLPDRLVEVGVERGPAGSLGGEQLGDALLDARAAMRASDGGGQRRARRPRLGGRPAAARRDSRCAPGTAHLPSWAPAD